MSGSETTWLGIGADLKPLVLAGVALGLGLGGFFDGIVFHQILQWHNLLSAHPDPAVAGDGELNMLADGLFHLLTYVFTVLGAVLLLRAWKLGAPSSGRTLFGSFLAGWGLFNLIEGTVNHFLLGIHHVRPDGPGGTLFWDVAFLVWGAVFLVGLPDSGRSTGGSRFATLRCRTIRSTSRRGANWRGRDGSATRERG